MTELTVATWNIWVFGDRKTGEMAEVIKENSIDVVGIQEAAIYYDEEDEQNTAKDIAEELGYHYEFYPALDFRPEKPYKMGNAVISRFPIESSEYHELNPENLEYDGSYETEPRILVETSLDLEGNAVSFLTTHLQYSFKFQYSDIRDTQVKNILSVLKHIESPTVLTGDFNSTLENKEIELIQDEMEKAGGSEPTWTVQPFDHEGWEVNELEYRLDNIFVSEEVEVKNSETVYSELSDHLPVKARIDLTGDVQ